MAEWFKDESFWREMYDFIFSEERFDDAESIGRNVRQEIMSPTGILRIEPFFLLADEVREPRNYAAVLRAIGEGHHTLDAITLAAGRTKQHVS